MLDLTVPGSLKVLAERIKNDIDDFCVAKYNDGPRSHLGASQIGQTCTRDLWYKFRWITHKVHTGRQYRLFQRGHLEEPRFKSYLDGIGCTVKEFDNALWYNPQLDCYFVDKFESPKAQGCANVSDDPAHIAKAAEQGVKFDKGKAQIRISGCKGHFGGSLDAVISLPKRYEICQDVLFLGEYKTSGTGPKFNDLVKSGCKVKKFQHYCQQCVYGLKLGLKYGIYIVVNKDNDDLYVEVIELDWLHGELLEQKAESIIFSQDAPEKISKSPLHYECKYCDSSDVCWKDKPALRNCRSCVNARPVDNAEWECRYHGIIPKDFISKGCANWYSII